MEGEGKGKGKGKGKGVRANICLLHNDPKKLKRITELLNHLGKLPMANF